MGSKNNPGAYDAYRKAHPDEPMFTLLGRDPDAPMLVRLWASIRARSGEVPEKVTEALHCANDMEAWRDRPAGIPVLSIDVDICARCGHDRRQHATGICAVVVADVICQCDGFVEQEMAP